MTTVRRGVAVLVTGVVGGSLLLGACSQGGNEVDLQVTGTAPASPRPTSVPPTDSSPTDSAPTSTGSGGTDRETSARPRVVGTVATGLEVPWGLAFLPDGDAIVTERDSARVLRVSPEGDVTELGTVAVAEPGGEAGLLGVALSPDFASDRRVYLYVSTADDNRVVRAEVTGDRLGPVEPVFTGIPKGDTHDGGRLLFGPDGDLYVSTGDAGERERAQDRDDLGGKILRITPEGDPAPGNPFDSAVWSWGHRNVQGLALDERGRLWASEFGENAWDELNLVEEGLNYGWPLVEGRAQDGTAGDFVDPLAQWRTDEASPSGLAFTADHLYLAALRGQRLWRVPVTAGGVGEPEGFLVGEYGRMRTVAVAPDGMLWVTTSNRDGRGDPAAEDDRILLVRP